MEETIWPDCVKNEEVLQTDEDKNFLYTVKRMKANRFGRVFSRNCLLKNGIKKGNKE